MPIVLTGVALAAPVSVLAATDGTRELALPLVDGGSFRYTYRQSIYVVQVVEELVSTPDGIRIARVRSTDVRAVEYFRWDGPIRDDHGSYVQDAPANEVKELQIRVTPGGEQRIVVGTRSISLRDAFGDAVVHVRIVYRPLVATVLP